MMHKALRRSCEDLQLWGGTTQSGSFNLHHRPARCSIAPITLQYEHCDELDVELWFEKHWVLSRLPFETAWAALMISSTLADTIVRTLYHDQAPSRLLLLILPVQILRVALGCKTWDTAQQTYMVNARWVLLSVEQIARVLLYMMLMHNGVLGSCSMVKRGVQDVCLVPLTTMIISPLIIRRQLWLTGVLLVLTTILIAGRNGLAHSLMDISKRDSDCMVVGPLEWMGNGLSMLSWYSGQQSTSTLEHTAAPLLWLIHVIMAQCVPMVAHFMMELNVRCKFLRSVGMRPDYRGVQGQALRVLLLAAAVASPCLLWLLWNVSQTVVRFASVY